MTNLDAPTYNQRAETLFYHMERKEVCRMHVLLAAAVYRTAPTNLEPG